MPVEKVFVGQLSGAALGLRQCCPAGQARQTPPPVEYVPAGQGAGDEAAEAHEYPLGQFEHVDCPGNEYSVGVAQAIGVEDADPEHLYPAGQIKQLVLLIGE